MSNDYVKRMIRSNPTVRAAQARINRRPALDPGYQNFHSIDTGYQNFHSIDTGYQNGHSIDLGRRGFGTFQDRPLGRRGFGTFQGRPGSLPTVPKVTGGPPPRLSPRALSFIISDAQRRANK